MLVFKVYLWADGTYCEPEDLEEYLKFMSDDFMTVEVTISDDTCQEDVEDLLLKALSNA